MESQVSSGRGSRAAATAQVGSSKGSWARRWSTICGVQAAAAVAHSHAAPKPLLQPARCSTLRRSELCCATLCCVLCGVLRCAVPRCTSPGAVLQHIAAGHAGALLLIVPEAIATPVALVGISLAAAGRSTGGES